MSGERDHDEWVPTAIAVVALLGVTVGLAAWLSIDPPAFEPSASSSVVPAADVPTGFAESRPLPAEVADDARGAVRTDPGSGPAALDTGSIEEVVGAAIEAVVLIETPTGRGTGFFVAPDTLLSNAHVVGSQASVTIRRAGGQTATARVETTAPAFDVAVLKVADADRSAAVLPLGTALNARAGQDVIAIGSALGTLQSTVTRGIVSALRQSGHAMLVQTDAAINPGNSGGPLLDRQGRVIGITTMGYVERQGLGFAVAIDHARGLLDGSPADVVSGPRGALLPHGPTADSRMPTPAMASDTDRARADGAQLYDDTLRRWAEEADALDEFWQRFRSSCPRIAEGRGSHGWFAALTMQTNAGATPPGCGQWLADIRERAGAIERAVLAADEAARRADVYPGTRRDSRRRHRLDHDGWDR